MKWTATIEKQSGEEIPEAIDYTDQLPPGKTVSSAVVTATRYPEGTDATSTIISGSPTVTPTRITAMLVAGTDGKDYRVTFVANLTGGGKLEDDILLQVRDL